MAEAFVLSEQRGKARRNLRQPAASPAGSRVPPVVLPVGAVLAFGRPIDPLPSSGQRVGGCIAERIADVVAVASEGGAAAQLQQQTGRFLCTRRCGQDGAVVVAPKTSRGHFWCRPFRIKRSWRLILFYKTLRFGHDLRHSRDEVITIAARCVRSAMSAAALMIAATAASAFCSACVNSVRKCLLSNP